MMEALRLFPPLIMLLRQAKAPFAVTTSQGKTYVIPKVSVRGIISLQMRSPWHISSALCDILAQSLLAIPANP